MTQTLFNTETRINKHGQGDTGRQEVKTESENGVLYVIITLQNRPGLPNFSRAYVEKHGKAWVRGYIHSQVSTRSVLRSRVK